MIEFLPIKIESTVDWSLLLAVLTAIVFYFGKLINEVSPYKENKYAIYVSGATYVVLFIIFPPLVLYTMFESHLLIIPVYVALITQFLLSWYLGIRLNAYNISLMNLNDFVSEIVVEKTRKISQQIKLEESNKNTKRTFEFVFYGRFPQWMLFLFAILNYWFTISIIVSNTKPMFIFVSFFCLIVSLSSLAVFYAYTSTKYPTVTIHLEGDEKISGELTKIDSGFINIIKDNKIYHIIDSKVKYIEVDILKESSKKSPAKVEK